MLAAIRRWLAGQTTPRPATATPVAPRRYIPSQPRYDTPASTLVADETIDTPSCAQPGVYDWTAIMAYPPAERVPSTTWDVAALEPVARALYDHVRRTSDRLPPFPSEAMRLLELARRSDTTAADFSRLISRDPTLTVSLLRMANSSIYAAGAEVTSIRDAVVRLGLAEVARLAAAISVASAFASAVQSSQDLFGDTCQRLLDECLGSAFSASWLAIKLSIGDADRAFLGGMLCDIGKVLALDTLATMKRTGRLSQELDSLTLASVLESQHIQIGAMAMAAWELPDFLTEICRYHHGNVSHDAEPELDVVRIATGLTTIATEPSYPQALEGEVTESLQRLGIGPGEVIRLYREMRGEETEDGLQRNHRGHGRDRGEGSEGR